GGIGEIADAFGGAFVAGVDLEAAIRWYERAVAADDGTAPMKAAEQLVNLRIRLASDTVERARKERDAAAARLKEGARGRRAADRKGRGAARQALAAAERALKKSLTAARSKIRDAIAMLDKLGELQPTMERESLRGSAFKRMALIAAAAGRAAEERAAIAAMMRHYQRAAVIGRETQSPNLFYRRGDEPQPRRQNRLGPRLLERRRSGGAAALLDPCRGAQAHRRARDARARVRRSP